jgi:6-pyruvoyltetrahydropterin/6-carboxytetrahydropterin synthase
MTWRLKVRSGFAAAHRLVGTGGKCESLHGHNFKVTLEVEGEKLDDQGMIIDFGVLKGALRSVLEDLDHTDLNSRRVFAGGSPSSENIARFIFEKVSGRLAAAGVRVRSVTVGESETASATYLPGENGD